MNSSPELSSGVDPAGGSLARWFSDEVQPHEPALRAYLRRKFPSLSDIDDLVQETYVRLDEGRACPVGG